MASNTLILISGICFATAAILAPFAKTIGRKLLVIIIAPIVIVSVLYFGVPLLQGRNIYEYSAWAGLIIPLYSLPGMVFSFLGLLCRLMVIDRMIGAKGDGG